MNLHLSFLLGITALFPAWAQQATPGYVCGKCDLPPVIDGKGDDAAWDGVRELSPLRDIEGSAIPHECRIKMLWDEQYLYILADMDEPRLWATLKEHDSVIYQDPDFEVFIDPDADGLNYIELEINALNTIWDLFIHRPYRFDDPHILHDWDIRGLKHAVHLRGTLNQPGDTDKGWSVELAIPWSSITGHANQPRTGKAPAPGTEMRFNFSRVNWQVQEDAQSPCGYSKLPVPESNHVWAPTGVVNIHQPEHWGRVIFSAESGRGWCAAPPAPPETAKLSLYEALNALLAQRKQLGYFPADVKLPRGVSFQYHQPDFFILRACCQETGRELKLDSRGNYNTGTAEPLPPRLYLWVHGKQTRSPAEWQTAFATYAAAGIDCVIIDGSATEIAALTPLAKDAGLEVFAWLWALNRPQDTTAQQHPDWYAVSGNGKSCHKAEDRPFVEYYQFLCPNNAEVKEHLLAQIRSLAIIPGLSGIQLDYMRLPDVELPRGLWDTYGLDMSHPAPEYDFCYCPTCRKRFGNEPKGHDWKQFRLQSVADLFNTLAAEIRRHGLKAACAVFPSPELAARMVHQDWSLFEADFVLPMVYHSFYDQPARWAADTTRQAILQSQNRIPAFPGIHLPDLPAAELPRHLRLLQATGVSGIGIFSNDELTPEHLQAIESWNKSNGMSQCPIDNGAAER